MSQSGTTKLNGKRRNLKRGKSGRAPGGNRSPYHLMVSGRRNRVPENKGTTKRIISDTLKAIAEREKAAEATI